MNLAIVGGGLTGLTAAYRLGKKGYKVTLFEKEERLGGLATSFKKRDWGWALEDFYHHFFTSDLAFRKLVEELGLAAKLKYSRPKTSIFAGGRISQLDSPVSLLTSPQFSLISKFRTGLATAYFKTTNDWQRLEKQTAWPWLEKWYGNEVFNRLWQPLLESKFGPEAKGVSLAWFWARVKKRSTKLGYLEGSTQIVIDKLEDEIKKNGGKIFLNQEYNLFDDTNRQSKDSRVVWTAPVSLFLKTAGRKLPKSYIQKLTPLKMLGALCLVLELKESFLTDGTYWLNINEKGFPFVAVVEHTNMVDPKHYGGNRIVYVGGYYPADHCYFKMRKEAILEEWLPYLRRINPQIFQLFTPSEGTKFRPRVGPITPGLGKAEPWAGNYQLSAARYAQPVVPVNYSKMIPPMKTPLPGVYLANMQMVYPWDRGINYAVEMGEKVANEVCQNEK